MKYILFTALVFFQTVVLNAQFKPFTIEVSPPVDGKIAFSDFVGAIDQYAYFFQLQASASNPKAVWFFQDNIMSFDSLVLVVFDTDLMTTKVTRKYGVKTRKSSVMDNARRVFVEVENNTLYLSDSFFEGEELFLEKQELDVLGNAVGEPALINLYQKAMLSQKWKSKSDGTNYAVEVMPQQNENQDTKQIKFHFDNPEGIKDVEYRLETAGDYRLVGDPFHDGRNNIVQCYFHLDEDHNNPEVRMAEFEMLNSGATDYQFNDLHFIVYNQMSKSFYEINVTSQVKGNIADIDIFPADNGFQVVGSCSNIGGVENPRLFYGFVDPNSSVCEFSFAKVDEESFRYIHPNHFYNYVNENGNVFVGQRSFEQPSTESPTGNFISVYGNYILKIAPDHTIQSMDFIPRYSTTKYNVWGGRGPELDYGCITCADKLLFFFSDIEKNVGKPRVKKNKKFEMIKIEEMKPVFLDFLPGSEYLTQNIIELDMKNYQFIDRNFFLNVKGELIVLARKTKGVPHDVSNYHMVRIKCEGL